MTKLGTGLFAMGLLSTLAFFPLTGCASVQDDVSVAVLTDDFEAASTTDATLSVLGVSYSLDEITARGTSSLMILEPFAQANTEFTVIDFGSLLLDAGLLPADRIVTIALNDYRYVDTVENFIAQNAKLAILENGEPIPVAKGGPVRIVFPTSSDYYVFLDAWNWSLASIELSRD